MLAYACIHYNILPLYIYLLVEATSVQKDVKYLNLQKPGAATDETSKYLEQARTIEWLAGVLKCKKQTWTSVVFIVEGDGGDNKVEKVLDANMDEFPKLLLKFDVNARFEYGLLFADNQRITTNADDIAYSIIVLVASYYCFLIEYNAHNVAFLSFLQETIFRDNVVKCQRSAKYKTLLDKAITAIENPKITPRLRHMMP